MSACQPRRSAHTIAALCLLATLVAWQPRAAAQNNAGSDSVPVANGSSMDDSASVDAAANVRGARYCINNMSRRIVWAVATAGGRNCAGACRGFGGGSNRPYVALNVGSRSSPSFLCRVSDPSFGSAKRAGYSGNSRGKATPCYAYANGGPKRVTADAVLRGRWLQCGCVADRTRYSFSGCPAPVWKPHVGTGGKPAAATSCRAVCSAAGGRNAIEDTPGQSRFVCRPTPSAGQLSTRIGWAAYQEGIGPSKSGNACHFVSKNAVTGDPVSVYSFDFQCLCV